MDYELNDPAVLPALGTDHEGYTDSFENSTDLGRSPDQMRQQLMVPFESMSNVSFENYVERKLPDHEGDNFNSSVRQMGDVLQEKSRIPSSTSLQAPTSRKNSRPNSGTNRLESLVNPLLGGNSGAHRSGEFY